MFEALLAPSAALLVSHLSEDKTLVRDAKISKIYEETSNVQLATIGKMVLGEL